MVYIKVVYREVFSKSYKEEFQASLLNKMDKDILMKTTYLNNFMVRKNIEEDYDIREKKTYHIGRLTIYGEDKGTSE